MSRQIELYRFDFHSNRQRPKDIYRWRFEACCKRSRKGGRLIFLSLLTVT